MKTSISCIHCKKVKTSTGFFMHLIRHHPITEEDFLTKEKFDIASENSKKSRQNKSNEQRINYANDPTFCKECGCSLQYKDRNNKFCGHSCSAIYSQRINPRTHSQATKDSISKSLLGRPSPKKGISKKSTTKIKNTKIAKVQKNIPNILCKLYFCKACGKIHKSHNDRLICECNFSTKIQALPNLIKYFNLSIDNLGTEKFLKDADICRNYAKFLYSTNSLPSLAKLVKHPDKTGGNIGKLLITLGIKLDSLSASQTKSILQFRSNPANHKTIYKSGYFTYMGKSYYYRSNYELEFAEYLMNKNISFEMENLRIEYFCSQSNHTRGAIPDFNIGKYIIEIKSNYTYVEIEMIDKFKAYIALGYEPILFLEKVAYKLVNNIFIICDLPI